MRRVLSLVGVLLCVAGTARAVTVQSPPATVSVSAELPRNAQPVVLTGAQIPAWSRLAAVGSATMWPSGTNSGVIPSVGDDVRSAHFGEVVVPSDARTGVDVHQIAAYRFGGGKWTEIPVQVDQRFPYFLANGRSSFSIYSSVDEELTYQWDDETWKKTAGQCFAEYNTDDSTATTDPVPTLDDDDEIVFMASDAGAKAPASVAGPKGTGGARQEISMPTVGYVYLFLSAKGPRFNAGNGYVHYERDANADEWIDRNSFSPGDPEQLGTGNTGYGPNISGTVCRTAPEFGTDGVPRESRDRFPRDGVTVTTRTYSWRAMGRWQFRELRVAAPGRPHAYGPDLVDRWKGRAFALSPDRNHDFSPGGFEEEQTHWEANSALLGERVGPVRAIREIWGADSGTNTTMTISFYRDAITYRSHLRVHPIPPAGVYSYWDYNRGIATRYFDAVKPAGVAVDGQNDDVGNLDTPGGQSLYLDVPDPTFNALSTILNWDEVSSAHGSLVYVNEVKGPSSVEHPTAVPFYRDDACLDDGTGSDPVVRPWPGEAQSDPRLEAYSTLPCGQKQGAYGSSGVHFLFTSDSDNAFQSKPLTELDAQQWQFVVPSSAPTNVGEAYADNVRVPLVVGVVQQPSVPGL